MSTKFRRRIEAVLQRDNLAGRFAVIVGGEDVDALKPDPTGLLRAAARLDGNVQRCLYVGDSVTDGETAQRAGVPFAAVLSGVTERNAFARYEPVMILGCAGDLPGALGLELLTHLRSSEDGEPTRKRVRHIAAATRRLTCCPRAHLLPVTVPSLPAVPNHVPSSESVRTPEKASLWMRISHVPGPQQCHPRKSAYGQPG